MNYNKQIINQRSKLVSNVRSPRFRWRLWGVAMLDLLAASARGFSRGQPVGRVRPRAAAEMSDPRGWDPEPVHPRSDLQHCGGHHQLHPGGCDFDGDATCKHLVCTSAVCRDPFRSHCRTRSSWACRPFHCPENKAF